MPQEDEESKAFRVNPNAGLFEVADSDGQVMLTCGDERSAEQYATLMNTAYRRGYKAGFRAARRK